MKKFIYSILLPAVLSLGFVMTSCSSDDDNNNGDNPNPPVSVNGYTNVRYNMSGSSILSIEFFANGQYRIEMNSAAYPDYSYSAKSKGNKTFVKTSQKVSRAYGDGVYYGSYTKTGEDQYNLEGFGTVVVNKGSGNNYSLTVTTNAGTETLSATKAEAGNVSSLTKSVCRGTWNFTRVGLKVWVNGKVVFDKTLPIDRIEELDPDYDGTGEYDTMIPKQLIVSEYGTYTVFYANYAPDTAMWRWKNESKGIFEYNWDWMWDDDDWCPMTISVSGNNLTTVEDDEYTEDGDTYLYRSTFYATLAK